MTTVLTAAADPTIRARTTMTANKWLILVAMTGSLSMVMLDQTVVSVALPSMSRDLPLSASGQQWVINAYVLAMAALVAFGGKLGDVLGRVSTFRLGVVVFFLSSAACALVPHGAYGQDAIIAARAAQGVGAALMLPVSAAIVMAAFPDNQRGKAMAIYAGISQIFLSIGPLLGGYLTEFVTWRAVFWLNVPVGLAALLLVRIARPPNDKQAEARVKLRDLGLMAGGIAITVYAIQQATHWGWTSPATLVTLSVGMALTATFVLLQLASSDPLIRVRLFALRGFVADNVVMGLLQFGLLGIVLYSSLYGQDLLGFSPITAGLTGLPLILPITVAAQLGGRWFDRCGVRAPVLTGLACSAVGVALWTAALPHLQYGWLVPGMTLTGFGLGLTLSPTTTDALGQVDGRDRGQASGLVQAIRQLGGTLGIAVIGAVVLGIAGHGTDAATGHAAVRQSANAITAGFATATGAFVVALVAGWILLPHRVVED